MSGRFEATGILRMMPGRRTVPFASVMTGKVAMLSEAIVEASGWARKAIYEETEEQK